MASKIQIRRDTVANWNLVAGSAILAAGEIGYETDTRNLKIGDGTSIWSALKYQAPVYSGTNSTLAAATLAVDQTNNRVGVGTASPQAKLHTSISNPTNGIVEVVQNIATASQTGSQIQITQSSIQDWAIGQPAAVDAFAFWRGRNTSTAGFELMRITTTGRVGVGTESPAQKLDINGNITSNRTIAGQFVVSGDGQYAFGADSKTYIYGVPGNSGSVAIFATNAGGTTAQVVGASSTGVAITGALSTSGLYTANAGITVPSGQTFTVASGGTVSFPSGSIAGSDIATGEITATQLGTGSVTAAKIASSTVFPYPIGTGTGSAIGQFKTLNSNVTTASMTFNQLAGQTLTGTWFFWGFMMTSSGQFTGNPGATFMVTNALGTDTQGCEVNGRVTGFGIRIA